MSGGNAVRAGKEAHMMRESAEAIRSDFRLDVPEYFNFAVDVLGRWARDSQRRAMLWTDERGAHRELTYREIDNRSSALAAGLREAGIQAGVRVLLIVPPEPEWW